MTRRGQRDGYCGWMRRAVYALVLMVLLCACGTQTTPAGGSSAYPMDTAEDWVTYGDYLIELSAVSETTLDPDENELFEGEGTFRRVFTLTVDRVLWSRRGVTQLPPSSLDWTSGGWQFKNGNLNRRTRIEQPNQLQTGHRYVALCTHAGKYADGGDPWWCTRIPLVDGRLARPTRVRDWGSEPIWHALEGKTPVEAGQLLSHTAPDPRASPYTDKNAIDRYQAVAAVREASTTPN
jgi:hypothetical protein